jgi:hypothetical protein
MNKCAKISISPQKSIQKFSFFYKKKSITEMLFNQLKRLIHYFSHRAFSVTR